MSIDKRYLNKGPKFVDKVVDKVYTYMLFPNMGALCFPPFCKNTFCTITFELKHIG